MILPDETTVAVVDGEKLRLFRNKGMEPHIKLAEEAVAAFNPPIN
jgi:protein required for attachment to host cells